MTDINAESFSALNFWKSKLNFPLLAPPPPPPPPPAAEEDFKSNKSEWDEQNVTGAFGFWKQKAIQLQQETERYNARRNSRATVDLTNILRKSTSNSDLSSPDQPKTPTSPHSPLDIIATTTIVKTTTTTTTTSQFENEQHHHHHHSNSKHPEVTVTSESEDEEYSQKTTTIETTNTLIANQLEIKVGGETIVVVDDHLESKKSPRDYRRSRSISCEIIPLVPNATSTTVITESITTTTIVEEDKQSDAESDSSVEDSDEDSDSNDDTESEEYEEQVDTSSIKHHHAANDENSSANNSSGDLSSMVHTPVTSVDDTMKPDQASLDSAGSNAVTGTSSTTANINGPKANQPIQQPGAVTLVHHESQSQSQSTQPQPQVPAVPDANNNNTKTPSSSTPSTPNATASVATNAANRPTNPVKKDHQKSKSIGATLTRTVTKTFIRDSKESNKMPSTGTTPTSTTPKTKEPKVKLSKQEKERIKQEKQAQKKKEKDEKKQQKKDKKPIGKSLSLTDVKKPSSSSSSTSSNFADTKIFKVRLTQLVLANEGSLPAILTSTITVLSNSENVDVKQIFVGAENDSEVKSIRVRSDSGEKIDFSLINDTRIVAGLLILFFAELPQPLFNSKFYNDLIEIHDITNPQVKLNDLRNLISSLSQLRRSLLQILVTFFLSKYINNNPTMGRSEALQVMCMVFGPIFFRDIDPKTKHLNVTVREETLKLIIDNYVFLFEKTDQPDLKYESVDGKLLISEASVDKLIDKATDYYYPYNEKYFSLTFFISHIYFISASDLVDKLSTLFKENHIDTKKKWKKQRRSKKANCISESVRLWIDYCYREMREDKKLSQKILKAFPHLEAHIGSRLTQSRGFGNILRVPKFHSRTRSASFSESFLTTTTGVGGKDQLSAVEIAEQCTLADYDLFTNVRLSDWVRLMHGSVDPSTAPSLSAALKKSTTWCQWAMGEILSAEDKSQRVAIIVLLVDIAIACRDLANFNTAISILNALNNHHIKRLTATWESVSKETVSKIQQLENSLSVWLKPDPNTTAFTNICSSINSACVPHFSILRTVLSQIDNKIPTKTADGNINVDKLRTVFGIVVELQRLQQQRNYTMKPTKLFIQLQDINTLSMDELADLSLKCEAPVSKAKKYNSPEQVVQQDWRDQIKKTFAKPLVQTSVGIDLPRLASSFTFRENAEDVSINNGNKIQDINNVLLSLASITSDSGLNEKIKEQFNQYIPASTDPDSDFKRDLIRFLDEVCESDNSKLVNILKCCNQAIIAPVVIELTLNIAKAVPFMDAGGWRILISKTNPSLISVIENANTNNNSGHESNDDSTTTAASATEEKQEINSNNNNSNNNNSNIYVRHYKKQRSRSSQTKDYFEFEWFLQIELDQTCKNILSFDLKVSSLIFSTDTQATIRDPLLESFKDYIVSQDCIQYINLKNNSNESKE
ncbi:hypothetical protein CYY_001393 [Polysphondylium violaceum]|uniref:Uncharacterized protein n=1 Tax=Polysphondylium violaceum TaxID=133409 RepID=A0A8J4V803_9MYCE|nr:hypothetical protein CYY_001393 [Polysphondylium violaceum]